MNETSRHVLPSRAQSPDVEVANRPARFAALASPDPGVGIERVDATLYYLYQRLGDERYWRTDLRQLAGLAGGYLVHQLNRSAVLAPALTVDDDDATVVYGGASWITVTGQAGAYGLDLHRGTTAGDTATWTTPAAVTRVGARIATTTNVGVFKVTIDGDATRATLLPTAQELVDNGQLASTVLVAGGGTLNPTDRVCDGYAGSLTWDVLVGFADDLAPAAHTVVVTVTGYKRSAASDTRVYLTGLLYATGVTRIDTATAEMMTLVDVLGGASAYEYAHEVTPTGATTPTFVGNLHGYEAPVGLAVTVNGSPVTLTDGQRVFGNTVQVTRATNLRHPEVGAGATNIASVSTVYRLNRDGLRITHSTVWAVGGAVSLSYPAMLPTTGTTFLRGGINTFPGDFPLVANDGTFWGRIQGSTAWMWQRTGPYAAAMHLPDPGATLGAWVNSGSGSAGATALCIQDRADNINKAYATRVGAGASPATVAAGATWSSDFLLRVGRLPGGADEVMASSSRPSVDIQTFLTSGTWTKPSWVTTTSVVQGTMIGPGHGGASGRRGAPGTVRCGGGGGGAGGTTRFTVSAAALPATVAVTLGSPGAGGAAVTVDDTNGNPGALGGACNFGTYAYANVAFGAAAGGGTNAAGTAGSHHLGWSDNRQVNGGAASGSGGAGGGGNNTNNSAGGGAGGGLTGGNTPSNGGAGGQSMAVGAVGGAAGVAGGSTPTTPTATGLPMPSGGGGGGGASATVTAQAGAAGGTYGGGGGGGGASTNGNDSGAGGPGGPGIIQIFTFR